MSDTDPAPDTRGNTCWVPVLRVPALGTRGLANVLGDLETRRTLWYLAVEGNAKAKQALRDGPEPEE